MEEHRGFPNWLQWVIVIVVTIVASLLIRRFVAECYQIPSGSMLETIKEGDYVLGEKLSIAFQGPQVGQIVTFDDPSGSGYTLIKRVIALGGQTVDFQDGKLVVDGVVQEESYTLGKPSEPFDQTMVEGGISYPYEVPEGYVWLMGDNRTNSRDSRYFGAVPLKSVTSHAVWTYWPISSWGALS